MRRVLLYAAFLTATLVASVEAQAQRMGVKTNLLYDATATINLGVEARVADRWTVDVSGNYNGWNMGKNNRKWKHWLLQPEARYWFCEAFNGHFVGAHLLGGEVNVGHVNFGMNIFGTHFRNLKNYRYEGWYAGLGVAYGYSFILADHWNLELTAGLGYIHARYNKYQCQECGERVASNLKHNYFGPTKLGVTLMYTF